MNNRVLSLSLRPKTIHEIIGQKTLINTLIKQFNTRLPHFFILYGPVGSGKTTLARMISLAIQLGKNISEISTDDWVHYKTFDISEINAANKNGVDFVREIIESMRYKPLRCKAKIVIFDEAHQLTQSAQNALLTETEDVSNHVFYIFCTSENSFIDGLSRRGTWFCTLNLKNDEISELVRVAATKSGFKDDISGLVRGLCDNDVRSSGLILQSCEKFFNGSSVTKSILKISDSNLNVNGICACIMNGKWTKLKPVLRTVKRNEIASLKIKILYTLNNSMFHNYPNVSVRVSKVMKKKKKISDNSPYACYSFCSAICRACAVF